VFIELSSDSSYKNSVQIEKVSGGPVIRASTHFSIEPGWLLITVGVCPHIRPGFQSSFAVQLSQMVTYLICDLRKEFFKRVQARFR